ncbi:MAG: hypothetical protein M1168_01185 [Candidatus Marsarchaeota archaeon]|nr:hypothetical protein [Candidatus Marsarchaeota archaeon]
MFIKFSIVWNVMKENNKIIKTLIPPEFKNIRFFSFLLLMITAIFILLMFPVSEYRGYIDPFYSPTILIIPIIALFRLTCYGFRKSYNRHLFKHPQSCIISRQNDNQNYYTGETSLLFRIENLHRYFMYFSLLILPFFYYDLYLSFVFNLSILRLGSIFLLIDTILLTLYIFSCHSIRNLIGGNKDCFSCLKFSQKRKKIFDLQSFLNSNHEFFAWSSLVFIIFVDLYIRAMIAFHFDIILLHI